MTNIFYNHLIAIDEIEIVLNKKNITVEEKREIFSVVNEGFHHEILNLILTHLPKIHHENFLTKFYQNPSDPKHLDFLKREIKIDIEKEIKNLAKKIKREILLEIKSASKSR